MPYLLASDRILSIGQVRCQDAWGLPMHLVAFTELILPGGMRKVCLALYAFFLARMYYTSEGSVQCSEPAQEQPSNRPLPGLQWRLNYTGVHPSQSSNCHLECYLIATCWNLCSCHGITRKISDCWLCCTPAGHLYVCGGCCCHGRAAVLSYTADRSVVLAPTSWVADAVTEGSQQISQRFSRDLKHGKTGIRLMGCQPCIVWQALWGDLACDA